jgi:putative nucleotidyltransferase with HDIG domain
MDEKDLLQRKVLAKLDNIPALSSLVLESLKLSADPNCSFKEISELVGRDPALASKLMKIANSAYFGVPEKVESVQMAVSMIGFQMLRRILTSVSTYDLLGSSLDSYCLEEGSLWSHSLAISKTAVWVSGIAGHGNEDILWSAGLFHDLGKVVINDIASGTVTDEEVAVLQSGGPDALELEKKVCGEDHAEISAMIAEKWHFSPVLVDVMRFHHQPALAEHSKDASIICLADGLSHQILSDAPETSAPQFDLELLEIIGVGREALETGYPALFEDVRTEISAWSDDIQSGGA